MKFGFTVVGKKNINQNLPICSEMSAITFFHLTQINVQNKGTPIIIKYNNYSADILSFITNVKPMIACLIFKPRNRTQNDKLRRKYLFLIEVTQGTGAEHSPISAAKYSECTPNSRI